MKRFIPHEKWHAQSVTSGAFAHLNTLFGLSRLTDWPDYDWFTPFLDAHTGSDKKVTFVADSVCEGDERYYEQIIYETGQVPTREKSWHDLFGGFIWCLFPKTKALINQRHVEEINQHGLQKRSKHRNALTLFDECGVILAVNEQSDECWPELLRDHQWKHAFFEKRQQWGKSIKPFMFGHANYEMMTKPYIGLTGKALFIKVPAEIFCKDLRTQYQYLDNKLYEMINLNNYLRDNRQLSPLPLLGVPGWCDDNKNPEYYSNTDYFRAKRRTRT